MWIKNNVFFTFPLADRVKAVAVHQTASSLTNLFCPSLFVIIFLRRCQSQTARNGAFSHKINYAVQFQDFLNLKIVFFALVKKVPEILLNRQSLITIQESFLAKFYDILYLLHFTGKFCNCTMLLELHCKGSKGNRQIRLV